MSASRSKKNGSPKTPRSRQRHVASREARRMAAVILEAATAPEAKLRYLVGADAEKLVGGRESLSDEEYLAFSELDDDTYRARFKAVFGIEL